MSCVEWARLQVELTDLESDGERDESLSMHLDHCSECRELAVDLDPLAVFRRLAAPSAMPEIGEADIASVRDAVATMRRTDHLQRRSRVRGVRHFAAAALLAVVAGGVSVDRLNEEVGPAGSLGSVAAIAGWTERGASPIAFGGPNDLLNETWIEPIDDRSVQEYLASLPAVEDLDRPTANVYQVEAESSTFLMIVDDDLDV